MFWQFGFRFGTKSTGFDGINRIDRIGNIEYFDWDD
jgi:hypothetical protein